LTPTAAAHIPKENRSGQDNRRRFIAVQLLHSAIANKTKIKAIPQNTFRRKARAKVWQ
jgi:hypothetical protein